MQNLRIHFMVEAGKMPDDAFAQDLIRIYGQAPRAQADAIVSIGGDGILMHALREAAANQNVFGIVPPGSLSRAFWTNKGVANIDDLQRVLDTATSYRINPLKADITFEDGTQATRFGYNDISVRSVYRDLPADFKDSHGLDDIDVGIQSMLVSLKASFANAAVGPFRIMGTGLIFATPFGSTAMNRNYSGPAIDIRENAIVLTGMGATEPVKGFAPIVNNSATVFDIDVLSAQKRAVMMTFDSYGVYDNASHSPIKHISIAQDRSKSVSLMLTDDPGIRAYSAMTL